MHQTLHQSCPDRRLDVNLEEAEGPVCLSSALISLQLFKATIQLAQLEALLRYTASMHWQDTKGAAAAKAAVARLRMNDRCPWKVSLALTEAVDYR